MTEEVKEAEVTEAAAQQPEQQSTDLNISDLVALKVLLK